MVGAELMSYEQGTDPVPAPSHKVELAMLRLEYRLDCSKLHIDLALTDMKHSIIRTILLMALFQITVVKVLLLYLWSPPRAETLPLDLQRYSVSHSVSPDFLPDYLANPHKHRGCRCLL